MFNTYYIIRQLVRDFHFRTDGPTSLTASAAEQTINLVANLEKEFAYFEPLRVKTEEERIIEFKDAFQSGYLGALCMELYNKRDWRNSILNDCTINTCLFINWLSGNASVEEIAAGFSHFCNDVRCCNEGYKVANDFVALLKMKGSDLDAIQYKIKNFITYICDNANIAYWQKETIEKYMLQDITQESMEDFLLSLMPVLNERILLDFYNAVLCGYSGDYFEPYCAKLDSSRDQNVNQVMPMPGSM